jgi:hypothetical protein
MKTPIRLVLLLPLSSSLLYGANDRIYQQRMKAEQIYRGFSVKRPTDKNQYLDAENSSNIDMIFHRDSDSKTHSFFPRHVDEFIWKSHHNR